MTTEAPHSNGEPTTEQTPAPAVIGRAYDLLQKLLQEEEGVVSTMQLRQALVSQLSISRPEAKDCTRVLRFLDAEGAKRIERPEAKTYHQDRSFLSKEKYDEVLAKTEQEASEKEQEAEDGGGEDREKEEPQNRQEEARLGVYVKTALENIYDSDHAPAAVPTVFDVHRDRPGGGFENVDLIAVHWRSESTVDLISVEVKLEFSPRAVHQACSYTRFSHRVWVACVVNSEALDAALELRSADPGLFEYAVNRGIGILGCRRSQGRSYQVFPIHWPAWQNPEPIEKEHFVERYRSHFEEAGVLERKKRTAKF